MGSLTKMIGAEFTVEGVALAPVLPLATYRFASPLLGLERSSAGYFGRYDPPAQHGRWTIRLKLPSEEAARIRVLSVNGAAASVLRGPATEFVIEGDGGTRKRLAWTLNADRTG